MKLNTPFLPPGEFVILRATDEAQRYAEAFHLIDQVRLASRLPETAICVTSEKHDTHWLVVGLFRDFAKPEDNGMNFMAFPKTRFTLEQVQTQLRSFMGSSYIEIKKDAQETPGYDSQVRQT